MNQQVKILSGINIVLGAWLIIAPFVMGYTDTAAMWNSIIVGVIVAILAWIRAANPASAPWLSWVNAVLGVWLIIAPFILGFSGMTGSKWTNIVVGVGIAIFGAWSALATPATTT
jgi:hypothetical protein